MKYKWHVDDFPALPAKKKAFVMAVIDMQVEEEKKQADEIKRKGRRR